MTDEPSPEHYFTSRPGARSAPERVEITLPDVAFTMLTDTGVFSHGRLDAGTALLLRSVAPPPDAGHLLDLGCGAGPIALTMALRAPNAYVWAVDVNERALGLTRENAAAIGVTNLEVCRPDAVPSDVRFATIWSNPPIRIGKPALHDLLTTWLGRLDDTGDAWIVVQRHLGADSLQRWLQSHGWQCERAASRSGFRVLHTKSGRIVTSSP